MDNKSRSYRWEIFIPVIIAGFIVVLFLLFSYNKGIQMTAKYAPLVDAAMEIKLEATTAHLWLEKILSGNQYKDMGEVWKHIDMADWYARAMLEGGQNPEGTYLPLEDEEMRRNIIAVRKKLSEFRIVTQKRFEEKEASAIGTDIDQQYDVIFEKFIEQADNVETMLQGLIIKDLKQFRIIRISIIFATILLTIFVGIVLNRYERRKKKNIYELENINKSLQVEITERKQAEEALRDSESLLRKSQKVANLGSYILDIPSGIWKSSLILDDVFGIDKKYNKDVSGWLQIIHPEDRTMMQDYLALNVLTNHEPFKKEYRIKRINDQQECWVQGLGELEFDGDGNPIKMIGTIQDITERKRAENKIRESQQCLSSHLENTPLAAIFWDVDFKVTDWNNSAEKIFGYTKEEALGKHANELIVPKEIHHKIEDVFNSLLAQVEGERGTNENITKNGERILCDWYNVALTDLNGKVTGVASLVDDITERKKTEKEILKLSRGIEQSPAMVVITDLDGNMEFINPKVTEVTGYSPKELIGRNTSIFQSGRTPKETYKELWDTILKGETWEGEILNKRKNGEEYWESERISQIFNDKGEVINYISIREDITESIKARNDLLEAKEKAEEANRIKSIFLANMSHELRTPMVGIIGFTEILENECEKPELQEYATFIHEAASRLMESLNLILNLTKIDAEKINIELSKIDVIKNIKRTMSIFDKIAANKNIYLKFESAIEQLETETDERMFEDIINNLVNNAVKFTDKGGVSVSVNKVKNKSYLEIKVKDTGIGIPKDKQEIIWEEFRQVSEGDERTFEGTGLGLTITNIFVNQLGGEIKLESELGKGSTFTVLLPIREKSISTKTKGPSFDITTDIPKTKDRQEELKSLLYVDDDKISRDIIARFLRGVYKIDLALNGQKGLEKAKKKKYDGILMDINLQSKPDGTITAEKIKEMKEYKNVPIIAVTAYAMVGDRKKYLEAGFTDYISKPFPKNDLIELLNKTIKKKT